MILLMKLMNLKQCYVRPNALCKLLDNLFNHTTRAIFTKKLFYRRMKRPMVSMGIDKKKLSGNHATPILAPPLVVASRAEEILGNDAREKLLYNQVDNVAKEMATWLEQLGV